MRLMINKATNSSRHIFAILSMLPFLVIGSWLADFLYLSLVRGNHIVTDSIFLIVTLLAGVPFFLMIGMLVGAFVWLISMKLFFAKREIEILLGLTLKASLPRRFIQKLVDLIY